jgi:hypothetical protein
MKTIYLSKKQIVACIATVLMGFTACTADWLAPEPLSFYSPELAFVDAESMNAALSACERNLRDEYYGDGMPLVTEYVFSDVAVEGVTDKAPPAQDLNLQIVPTAQLNNMDYNKIGWYWIEGYRRIKFANAVITRIDDITFTNEAERNAILSAAYFHRSFQYYRLTNQFGDVPYVGGEVQTPKVNYYSTKREVILQSVKKNMDFAAQWAELNPDRGRVTRGACGHLLTKINLTLGLFDEAIASASAVINSGQHALMTGRFGQDANNAERNVIYDLHHYNNKSILENKEALLTVISRENVDDANNPRMNNIRNSVPAWNHPTIVTPSGVAAVPTYVMAGSPYNYWWIYGRGQGRIRGVPYSTQMIWTLDDTDLRHQRSWWDEEGNMHQGNWMEMEDLQYVNPAILTAAVAPGLPLDTHSKWYLQRFRLYSDDGKLLCPDTIRNWYAWPHYKTFIPDPSITSNDWRGGRYDWYIFRLAETYLLRAEAYFWKGDLQKAADDINTVRRRAQAREITANEVNMRMILDERARELYLEEPRKTELTRISYIYAQTSIPADDGTVYRLDNFSDKNFFFDHIMATTFFYNKGIRTAFGNYYTMSAYHVLWPIPQPSIDSNTLGIINQNKGYPGYEKNVPPLTEIE